MLNLSQIPVAPIALFNREGIPRTVIHSQSNDSASKSANNNLVLTSAQFHELKDEFSQLEQLASSDVGSASIRNTKLASYLIHMMEDYGCLGAPDDIKTIQIVKLLSNYLNARDFLIDQLLIMQQSNQTNQQPKQQDRLDYLASRLSCKIFFYSVLILTST